MLKALLIVFLLISPAFAQMSLDEANARLQARIAARAAERNTPIVIPQGQLEDMQLALARQQLSLEREQATIQALTEQLARQQIVIQQLQSQSQSYGPAYVTNYAPPTYGYADSAPQVIYSGPQYVGSGYSGVILGFNGCRWVRHSCPTRCMPHYVGNGRQGHGGKRK